MGARRASILVAVCMLLSIGIPAAVAAQAETADQQLCVSITGPVPADGWDVLTLSMAIASGNASITSVGAAADCASGQVAEPPDESEAEVSQLDVTATTPGTPSETPLPVAVVDAGLVRTGVEPEYVVILSNPNPGRWLASNMPIKVDLLDEDGELVNTCGEYVTLFPGQSDAVINGAYDAEGDADRGRGGRGRDRLVADRLRAR
jgi:hypothetical protein